MFTFRKRIFGRRQVPSVARHVRLVCHVCSPLRESRKKQACSCHMELSISTATKQALHIRPRSTEGRTSVHACPCDVPSSRNGVVRLVCHPPRHSAALGLLATIPHDQSSFYSFLRFRLFEPGKRALPRLTRALTWCLRTCFASTSRGGARATHASGAHPRRI